MWGALGCSRVFSSYCRQCWQLAMAQEPRGIQDPMTGQLGRKDRGVESGGALRWPAVSLAGPGTLEEGPAACRGPVLLWEPWVWGAREEPAWARPAQFSCRCMGVESEPWQRTGTGR